jgi:hypothetical protein
MVQSASKVCIILVSIVTQELQLTIWIMLYHLISFIRQRSSILFLHVLIVIQESLTDYLQEIFNKVKIRNRTLRLRADYTEDAVSLVVKILSTCEQSHGHTL